MKVAIVTAGGSGMGAAAARKLAQDGYKTAILSSSGKGEALAKELGGIGVTGSNQSADDLKRLVDQVMAAWGRVDVLVNSAGHGPRDGWCRCGNRDRHGVRRRARVGTDPRSVQHADPRRADRQGRHAHSVRCARSRRVGELDPRHADVDAGLQKPR